MSGNMMRQGVCVEWGLVGQRVRCRLDKDSTLLRSIIGVKTRPGWQRSYSALGCSESCTLLLLPGFPSTTVCTAFMSMDPVCCGRTFNGAASIMLPFWLETSIMLPLWVETSIRPLYHHSTAPLSSLVGINHQSSVTIA